MSFLILVETGPVRQSNREDCPVVNSRLSDRRMQTAKAPEPMTGAWLNSDTATRFGINERYRAVVENQDGGYDSY